MAETKPERGQGSRGAAAGGRGHGHGSGGQRRRGDAHRDASKRPDSRRGHEGARGGRAGGRRRRDAERRRDAARRNGRQGPGRSRPVAPAPEVSRWAKVHDRARLSEKMDRSVRARLFVQSTIPDFLLVLVMAVALVFTVSYGFESAWDYRGNVAFDTVLALPLLAALFVGTWSKRALLPSVIATIVVAVALVGGAAALSPDPLVDSGGVADTPGNYAIFAVIVVVVTVVTFLLSRRTVGLVFLLAAAIIASGLIQFLYREWMSEGPGVIAALVVIVAAGMLFIYHCYKQSVYSANRVKRTSFLGATAFSAFIAVVCVLAGLGVFYGIVQVSGLTTPDIKLFQEYVSPPVDENADTYERTETLGDDTSQQTDDEESQTNQQGDGASSASPGEAIAGALSNTAIAQAIAQMAGVDLGESSDNGDDSSKWFVLQLTAFILALLVVLLIVAIILLQRYRRTWRLKRIATRSNAYQVWFLYTFLLGRLRRLRIRKPAQLTPLEFAVGFSRAMAPFTRDTGGVDFVEVSSIYQDAAFGGMQPTDEQLDRVKAYYRAFFKNARIYVGWPKWLLWKFWRI